MPISMLKKYCLLFFLLNIYSLLSLAQMNPNTTILKIRVQDTLSVPIDKMTLQLFYFESWREETDEYEFEKVAQQKKTMSEQDKKKAFEEILAEITLWAKSNDIEFRSTQTTHHQSNPYREIGELILEGKEKVEKVYNKLKNMKDIRVHMLSQSSEQMLNGNQTLIKKLIEKGKLNAEIYAKAMQGKVGRLLEVSELHNQEDSPQGGWVVYPPLKAETVYLSSPSNFNTEANKNILLFKELRLKFEIE